MHCALQPGLLGPLSQDQHIRGPACNPGRPPSATAPEPRSPVLSKAPAGRSRLWVRLVVIPWSPRGEISSKTAGKLRVSRDVLGFLPTLAIANSLGRERSRQLLEVVPTNLCSSEGRHFWEVSKMETLPWDFRGPSLLFRSPHPVSAVKGITFLKPGGRCAIRLAKRGTLGDTGAQARPPPRGSAEAPFSLSQVKSAPRCWSPSHGSRFCT